MKVKTLLVDDSLAFLAAARRFLAAQFIDIVGEAHTGHAAIQMVETHKPDLVLLDWEMPELEGLEVLKRIKARQDPPHVIVVTFHDQDEYHAAAIAAGADGFVAKRELTTALMPLVHKFFDDSPAPHLT